MSAEDASAEPIRKKARTYLTKSDEVSSSSTFNIATSPDISERAKLLSSKIASLCKEFPEMNYIVDLRQIHVRVEEAVKKFLKAKEAEKRKQELMPLNSLPDEVLQNCMSYVGKGHYGLVAPASKKLCKAYKDEFGNKTAYLEMATSVQLTDYCINELCQSLIEKDEMFKAAAVNGNVDILRYAVSHGYDLFPLVHMMHSSKARWIESYYENEDFELNFLVKTFKLVERGHLHVLKYLHEELNYYLGLQRYCKPAIKYGNLDMLQWLQSIGCMNNAPLSTSTDFCRYAVTCGNLEVLQWLLQNGFEMKGFSYTILPSAIRSESLEMIQYCFDLGYSNFQDYSVEEAIKETQNVEVFRLMHKLGFEFDELRKWCRAHTYMEQKIMENGFEIIKFLRSISVPWDNGFMLELVAHGTLEMIQFAHEDGCPWTTRGDEYNLIFVHNSFSFPKLEYLIANGCTFRYEYLIINTFFIMRQKDCRLLDYFVGRNSRFDNRLLQDILIMNDLWFQGMSYLMKKGKDIQKFKSIEEVFQIRKNIDGIKFFHGLGLPWCLDKSRNAYLLSKIACFNDLEDIKWAYKNGCKGGDLVPYVKEEWKEYGIRQTPEWKRNQTFFVENGMLAQTLFEENKVLCHMNVKEIGDAALSSKSTFLEVDYIFLKSLLDHGYTFPSLSEKEFVTKEAFKECCRSLDEKCRKRFTIFQQIGVRAI